MFKAGSIVFAAFAGVVLAVVAMLTCACGNKANTVPAMQLAYSSTFGMLVDANVAGVIDDDTFRTKIVPLHRIARSAIAAAKSAEARGDSVALDAAIAAFDQAVKELEPYKAKAKAALQPQTQAAGLDFLGLMIIIQSLLRTVTQANGIAGKMFKGQALTDEERKFCDDLEQQTADRVEKRAEELGG